MSLEQVLAKLDQISTRLGALEAKVGGSAPAAASAPAASAGGDRVSPALEAYDELVASHLGRFAELSQKIGAFFFFPLSENVLVAIAHLL